MTESIKTKFVRWGFNLFPAYRGTGARVTYIAHDYSKIHIKLPLSWRTRNYVGTIYGGSIYGAVDPMYMFMLLKMLGSDYVVWDKAASIRFKKPGRSILYSKFELKEKEIKTIKEKLSAQPSIDRTYTVELVDGEGSVHAFVEKTVYIRRKDR